MRADTALNPDTRDLYSELLKPPPGTVFDSAVATTFSLDFETALSIPVALTLFAGENREEMLQSRLTLLEGLERNAGRLAIFCGGGHIKAQKNAQSRLCALLERTIIEVVAPGGGAFHPKLWLLRYKPLDPMAPVALRLLILSRNLTCDRSWDLSLCLDGTVGRSRRNRNRPLVELIDRLPSLANGELPDHVGPLVAQLSADLSLADWLMPQGVDSISFAVNGLGRKVWKLPTCSRMGVVSPFCDAKALDLLADLVTTKEKPTLVGRADELAAVPGKTLKRFAEVWVMEDGAESEDGEDDVVDDDSTRPLRGLHAKAFIQESGWNTAITVGSGNATSPALISGDNVEVFATLTGKRKRLGGVADILGKEGFGRLLRPFSSDEVSPMSAEQRIADQRIDRARRQLVKAGLHLACVVAEADSDGQRLWSLVLQASAPIGLEHIATATCWPITRGEMHARDVLEFLRHGKPIEIGIVPLVDVTRFLAFHLVDTSGKGVDLFSLGATIDGLPAERHQALLSWAIDSREAFLRYLRLLLADLGDPIAAQQAAKRARSRSDGKDTVDAEPILEEMVRALTHDPARLQAMRRLMERLGTMAHKDDGSPPTIPVEFHALWDAFRTVLDAPGAAHG